MRVKYKNNYYCYKIGMQVQILAHLILRTDSFSHSALRNYSWICDAHSGFDKNISFVEYKAVSIVNVSEVVEELAISMFGV
jgi:hypothetical protein